VVDEIVIPRAYGFPDGSAAPTKSAYVTTSREDVSEIMAHTPDPDSVDPFGVPYVHGRDLVPIRRQPRTKPNPRLDRLFAEEDQLRDEIRQLDQQMLDLAARRQHLLQRVRAVHNEIRPIHAICRGRRRRHVTYEPGLPPIVERPTLVSGRELRALCLVFLRQAARALSLRDLHAQLHRAGYAVHHSHPAKALADALGHETDRRRCTRVKRGVYAVTGFDPDNTHLDTVALPDW
jgi:hypothetical protein